MFKYKKTAAFITGLLLCAPAVLPSVSLVYAENETSAVQEETSEETTESEASGEEDDGLIVSGDYSYSLNSDDTANIERYSGSEKNVSVPEEIDGHAVTEIARNAFGKTNVETIEIPACIKYIAAENPFIDSYSLKEIKVAEGNEKYCSVDGILYSKDKKTLLCYPEGKSGTSFTVPDGVTMIGICAFYSTQLTEILLPESVTELGRHSMSYNEKITSVDLSKTKIETIGIMAFTSCTNLTEIKFPDTLDIICGGAFAGCKALETVELPDSLTTVQQNAFAATGMKKVVIPPSVVEIEYCAFGYDEKLEPIDGFVIVGEAGSEAQRYAYDKDEEYEYENSFTFKTPEQNDIEEEFEDLDVQRYGDYGYAEVNGEITITTCTSTESVIEVPSEINGLPVTVLYPAAFYQNKATEIILPDTLKTMNEMSISMCTNLKKLVIPDSVTVIKDQAISGCSSLETVTIPGSCTSIGEEVFWGCTSLKSINVSGAEGGEYSSADGVLYNKDKTVLVAYPAAKDSKSFKAPKTVKEILTTAFCDAKKLEKADISSVETIGDYAFESCEALKRVGLSKNLKSVGVSAFYDCGSLKSVHLYDKLEQIGEAAFGLYYSESADTSDESADGSSDKIVEGFKIYTEDDTLGYSYAVSNKIKTVSGTIEIFGRNVVAGFAYGVLGVIAAAAILITALFARKKIAKGRDEKINSHGNAESDSKMKILAEESTDGKENDNEAE